jgi:hypothetical protein
MMRVVEDAHEVPDEGFGARCRVLLGECRHDRFGRTWWAAGAGCRCAAWRARGTSRCGGIGAVGAGAQGEAAQCAGHRGADGASHGRLPSGNEVPPKVGDDGQLGHSSLYACGKAVTPGAVDALRLRAVRVLRRRAAVGIRRLDLLTLGVAGLSEPWPAGPARPPQGRRPSAARALARPGDGLRNRVSATRGVRKPS